jgi:cholesterol oxidase
VGSGFGGSVIAYRLAEAGLRVCLLERGKAYPPGSFRRSPYRMRKNFWDPSEGLHGLYNFWGFRGLDALVVGQPLLVEVSSILGSLLKKDLKKAVLSYGDRDLPHYAQYEELVGYSRSSDHSVVLLTGTCTSGASRTAG